MNNLFIHIKRQYGDDNHTIGTCSVIETELPNDLITTESIKTSGWANRLVPRFTSISLERGWLDNKPNVSCIPKGEYHCVYEYSPAFKRNLWEIYGVEGRTECKFHPANYYKDLQGCVALGLRSLYSDVHDFYSLLDSGVTLLDFHISLKPLEGQIVKLIVE